MFAVAKRVGVLEYMNLHRQMSFLQLIEGGRFSSSNQSGNAARGEEVLYVGDVKGGPVMGSKGIIKRLYARKAVVDMGASGIWNVPYYFLGQTNVV